MNNFDKKRISLEKYVDEALFFYDLPGLSVSAGIGEFTFRKAAGYSDFLTKESLKESEFFHTASVSKTFVATGIMDLVTKGKLKLEDRLIDVLPWVKIDDIRVNEITIEHMLCHTAGLEDVKEYGWNAPELDDKALERYILSSEVRNSKLLWSPKENKFQYSNIGYEILGSVISKVSGVSFEEYIRDSLLEPLNMKNSTFLTFERGESITGKSGAVENLELNILKRAGGAMPHYKDKEKHIKLEECYPYNREHGPSSTLTSSLNDLEKWAQAAIERKLFETEIYDNIWRGRTVVPNNGEEMGLGWFIRKQEGMTLFGHEGTDDGFRASFWICPEKNAYVIVLSNLSQAPVKKINKGVFERLC